MRKKLMYTLVLTMLLYITSMLFVNHDAQAMEGISSMDEKAGIYSFRLLEEGYTGPLVEVRRSSDNSTLNIYATANGILDEQQLLNFIKNDNAYIKKWYDQSGHNTHAVQPINALQPMLVSEGVLQKLDGRIAVYFDETNELLLSSSNISVPLTINIVAKTTFGNGSRYIFDPNGAEVYRWNVLPAVNELRVGSDGLMLSKTDLDFNESFVSTSIINGSNSSITLNGSSISGSIGSKGITSTATIGSNTKGVGLVGYIHEILLFSDAITVSERDMIENNQIANYLTPDSPRNVKVSADNNKIQMQWQAPIRSYETVTGYKVEYKLASSSSWIHFGTTSNRKVTIPGLNATETYEVKVTSVNSYGLGNSSNVYTRKMGSNWGLIVDEKTQSNLLASTLYFPGVPNSNFPTAYTASPLTNEMEFDEAAIRNQLKRMKSIGINAVQISFFGGDILSGSKYLPMDAWRNRTDGQTFEDYDRLIRLIEEEDLYFYPLIETSSALPFYLDFGVNNEKLVQVIQYWTDRWGDSPSWIQLYNNKGESMHAVSFIEAVKFKPYIATYFEDNLHAVSSQIYELSDMKIGFLIDPTRLPSETEGGSLPSNFGPTPADLINSSEVLAIHPWEITVDGSTEEERITWASQFLEKWTNAGLPVVSFVIAGYDSSYIFPASQVYGKTDEWREMQKTLATPNLGTAGINIGPWNGWTEWFHITLSTGSSGSKNSIWAKEIIQVNKKKITTKPGLVENVLVSKTNNSLTLTWDLPVSNGGSEITDYTIQYKNKTSSSWITHPDGYSTLPQASISGLLSNTQYDVRIIAVNSNGTQSYSRNIEAKTL